MGLKMANYQSSVWRHNKTNHRYVIVGECRLEHSNAPAFLYTRIDVPDGIVWARDRDEFLDGRFDRLFGCMSETTLAAD